MKLKFNLFDISTIVISMFCLFPIFTGNKSYRIIVILACLNIVVSSYKRVTRANKIFVPLMLLGIVLSIMISSIIGIKDSINFFINISILSVFIFVSEYYRVIGIKKMKLVVIIILGFFFVSMLQTILILNINPAYARLLTKNQDNMEIIGLSGGYGLVYSALFLFFSTIFLIKKSVLKSFVLRVAFLIISITSSYLIWKAGFFLALTLLIFGLIVIILGINKKNIVKSITLIIFALGPLLIFQESISEFAISETIGTKYQEKVKSIFDADQEESFQNDSFDEREKRYLRDLKLLIEYPIVGTWQFKLVGKHSFVLDALAQFGLIFGSLFICVVFFIPYQLLKDSEGLIYTKSFVVFLSLVVFLLLNSFVISIIPVVFIIHPYSNYVLNNKTA